MWKSRFALPQPWHWSSDTLVCPLHISAAFPRSPFAISNHFPLYFNAMNVECIFVKFSKNKQEVRIKRQRVREKIIFIEHLSKITKKGNLNRNFNGGFMASFSYLPLFWSKYLRIRLFRWMKQKKKMLEIIAARRYARCCLNRRHKVCVICWCFSLKNHRLDDVSFALLNDYSFFPFYSIF